MRTDESPDGIDDETWQEVPGTIKRSPAKAQRTWAKAHDSAVETYGDGERAHRTAYSALKHSFEKMDGHWEPKEEKGPSDPQAAKSAPESVQDERETFGGVDLNGNTRDELIDRARKLGVSGTSRMNKKQLARAISSKQG
ncbi:MAG: ChaB family protein [Actinobacteria bacterium]|nr:ChaB family protein [Actinomycetota bacterium]